MPSSVIPQKIESFLLEKRNEIMWSLAVQQEYQPVHIQKIFNIKHLSTVTRIMQKKPKNWQSPWVKRDYCKTVVELEKKQNKKNGNGNEDTSETS